MYEKNIYIDAGNEIRSGSVNEPAPLLSRQRRGHCTGKYGAVKKRNSACVGRQDDPLAEDLPQGHTAEPSSGNAVPVPTDWKDNEILGPSAG